MEKNSKKELKVVLSAELYDELKYVFRPDQLENILYKPDLLGDKKWQCCCGSESEFEICPICGMEKHTVFSKVNANYLSHHRKERIARKRKAVQNQQAMMASQMIDKKNKKKNNKNKSSQKTGIVLGVLVVCIAVVACIFIMINGENAKKPVETADKSTVNNIESNTDNQNQQTQTDEISTDTGAGDDETTDSVNVDVKPIEVTPPEHIVLSADEINVNPATIEEGKWAEGASGNTSVGSLVYSGETYDFVSNDGIKILDKSGNEVGVLTTNRSLGITGSGSYVFYIDESNNIHKVNTETKEDVTFNIKAKQICACFEEIYYTDLNETGLFACNYDGFKTKTVTTLEVFAVSFTAGKLYFSTNESLSVISSKDGNVSVFCKDGAKATSILEITKCVFYTGVDGKLKFYNPLKNTGFSIEYPSYSLNVTHVSAYDNRVYIRTVNPNTQAVLWYSTKWVPGTRLFAAANFTSTGITTESLYVSNNAIYDGNMIRKPVA